MNAATPSPDFDIHSKKDALEETHTRRAIVFSVAVHGAILAAMIFKSVVAPDAPKEYIPSLRVDLVALPGHKINETPSLKPAPPEPSAAPVKEKPAPPAKPTEIKLPKTQEKADISIPEKTAKKNKSNEKIKNALAKIKALEKIAAMQKDAEKSEPIKGNQISKGSSISGEAKTSLETTYFDVVLEKVRGNWELPKWLQEQNLSAKVTIYLDRSGQLTSVRIIKSSGNDQFDQEVKRALQSSAPFPSPPIAILPEVATQGITLGFPI